MTYEELVSANKELETVDIKGKAYVQVNKRVLAFRKLFPMGKIETEIVDLTDGVVTMKAYVYDETGFLMATGYSQEKETSSYINKTSFIENAETSAVGRALGWLGIGVDSSMASAEEVANAIINQNKTPEQVAKDAYPTRAEMLKAIREKNKGDTENMSKILTYYKVTDLDQLKEEQIKAVYNKAMKK